MRFRGGQLAWRLCTLGQAAAAGISLGLILAGARLNWIEQAIWVGAWIPELALYYAARARLEGIQGLHRKFIDGFIDSLPPGRRH